MQVRDLTLQQRLRLVVALHERGAVNLRRELQTITAKLVKAEQKAGLRRPEA